MSRSETTPGGNSWVERLMGFVLVVFFFAFGTQIERWHSTAKQDNLIEQLGQANDAVVTEKNKQTSLLKVIEEAGTEKQQLLDTIASMKSKPSEVEYVIRTETKLVPEERVVIVKDLPPSHKYRWENGLVVAEFETSDGQYFLTTHDLTLRGTMVVGSKDTGLMLEGATSANPDHWEVLPVDLKVEQVESHKILGLNLGLGLAASYPDPALHPSVFLSTIHPTKTLDVATIRLGSDGRTASRGGCSELQYGWALACSNGHMGGCWSWYQYEWCRPRHPNSFLEVLMYIVYNYKCTNTECLAHEERMTKRDEVDSQVCEKCDSKMEKAFTAPVVPVHVSWSKWRV